MTQNNKIMQDMKTQLVERIEREVTEFLNQYGEPCVALGTSVYLDAKISVVHYSGNGRKNNRPTTIAEINVSSNTSGVCEWND